MGFTINEAAIQARVAKSASVRAQADLVIRKWVDTGVRPSGVSGDALTKAEMIEAARKLKEVIIQHGTGLPISVQDNLRSLGFTDPVEIGPGKYQILCTFTGDLTRPSLAPEKYPLGARNIIALFNNGYTARAVVIGEWPGHGRIASLQSRLGTHFLNAAVDAFNSTYGAHYHASAELSGEYQ